MEVVLGSPTFRGAPRARWLSVVPIPPQYARSSGLTSGLLPLQSMLSIPSSAALEQSGLVLSCGAVGT